jgi:DNA-binding response OmpR family regulator
MVKKILVVDDEPTTVQLIEFILKRQGYETITAGNGEQAITKAMEEKPDLILMDVMMPGVDGVMATQKLKMEEKTSGIPIIMVSALGLELEVMRGLQAGADGYVVKPFSSKEILSAVEEHLVKKK